MTSARCSHHPAAAACNGKEACQKEQQAGLKHHQQYQTGTVCKPALIYLLMPTPETCTIPIPNGKKGNLHDLGQVLSPGPRPFAD